MNSTTTTSDIAELSTRLARLESVLPNTSASVSEEEVDLIEFVRTLWRGKWIILSAIALSAAIAVTVARLLPNQYKATVILMPASTSETSSLSRLAGQFGNLASLAGVNLGGQGEGYKITAAMELIKSWGFQEQFIRDNHLEVAVYAAKGWKRLSNHLLIDPSIYDEQHNKWVRQYNPDQGQTAEPSGWELYKKLSERISISQDKKTNVITLSVEYYSPYLAKAWAEELIAAVNKHLQERDRIDAEKSIQYLEEKMNQTNLTEMKTVFARLIEEQTKNLMLSRVSDEYVLRTISPAKVPEEKSSPKRAIICLVLTLGGGILSIFVWLLWSKVSARRTKTAN